MIRVRFAPSPTGSLHLGSLRTAIVNFLFARKMQASFVLRIEDTDQQRSTEESTRVILDNLQWMGITFDEGPFFQTRRITSHQEYARSLVQNHQAYQCFCPQNEGTNEAFQSKDPCRELSTQAVEANLRQHLPHVIRLRIPDTPIVFHDLIKGEVSFQGGLLEDFVIVRSDGTPTYNFAVVADDHDMGITHVIRGEDHLSNTPKQIALYHAFSWVIPYFAHIPLILGSDKTKLSKRHCDTAIEDYKEKGFLAETLFNYLALLGYTHDPANPILSKEDLIKNFSWDKVSRSASQFDLQRLYWMNKQNLDRLSEEEYLQKASSWIPDLPFTEEKKNRIALLSRNQVKVWSDLPAVFSIFQTYSLPLAEAHLLLSGNQSVSPFLAQVKNELSLSDFSLDSIQKVIEREIEQLALKKRDAMQWLRIAVTGSTVSPALYETIQLLGQEETMHRLGIFLEQRQ
ncbi:MAG: glutamate--tRNA ligase [Caldisericia bacterium]|nr:glutamate--tRNA ligase [Caldisericia bacterium]